MTYGRALSLFLHAALLYLSRVLGLLGDISSVGVLRRPELLLLAIGEDHRR